MVPSIFARHCDDPNFHISFSHCSIPQARDGELVVDVLAMSTAYLKLIYFVPWKMSR